MGAHGADKLLEDVQTYHDMHNEIVVQKMHQITPPCTRERYGERPCGNPQCAECPKPGLIAVGFSSSEQKVTIISENEARGPSPDPLAASSPTAGVDKEADSSPPRSMAARTLSPPRIVKTPSNPFDNATPDNLFISPHLGKWDPIKDGRPEETPEDEEDIDRLLKKQRLQNERDMQDIPVTSRERPLTMPSSMPRKGCWQGSRSKGRGRLSKCSRTRGISRSCVAHTT
jgi:hypothetical protein